MRPIALAVGLWGCAAPAAGPATPPPDPTPSDPVATSEVGPTDAELVAEAEAVTRAALDEVLAIDPSAIERSYDDAMSMGDGTCPGDFGGYWVGACDSASGASFDGFAFEFTDASYGYAWSVYGEAVIGRPDDTWVTIAGYAGYGDYTYAGVDTAYHYAYGTFLDEGDDSWLGDDHDMGLFVSASTDETGRRAFEADGTLGTLMGDRALAADFLAFQVAHPAFAWGVCDEEVASGVLFVRTASARWVEVAFGDRCDGCADLWDGDRHLGEACFDVTAMLDWEVSPW